MKIKIYLVFLILPIFNSCNNDEMVSVDAEKITLNHASIELKGGNTLQLIATISPSNTTDKEVIWESSDTTIVSVNNKGVVKPINIGSTEITASTNNNNSVICEITVTTSGSWDKKADFGNGIGRHGTVSFTIGDRVYVGLGSDYQYDYDVFGGGNSREGGFKKDFWEYKAETDTWIKLSDFPGGKRTEAIGFSINGKGYVGLGTYYVVEPNDEGFNYQTGFKQDFWEYNPSSDSWIQLSDFPGEKGLEPIGFAILNKGYVGCSFENKDFWEFSPSENSWNQLVDYPGKGYGLVGFSIDDKGYVGLGVGNEGQGAIVSRDFWEYSPETNTWDEKQSAIFPNYYDATSTDYYAAYNATGFSIYGEGYVCLDLNSLWKYNPTNNEWTGLIERFPSVGRNRLKSKTNFVVNGKAFLGLGLNVNICGNHCQTGIANSSIYQFVP